MQHWHTGGVVTGSFRPEAERCAWRAYRRQRAPWLEYRAAHSQHLPQLHVQLTQGLSAMTGATGRAIIRALVRGERDPVKLARWRDRRCARSAEEIATAVTGHDQPAQVCVLQQALAWYDGSTQPLGGCAAERARPLQAITPEWPEERPPVDRDATRDAHRTNAPPSAARGMR